RSLALVGLLALPVLCIGALVVKAGELRMRPAQFFPRTERQDLDDRCIPAVEDAEQQAKAIAAKVSLLWKRQPVDWTAQEFDEAAGALRQAGAALIGALELVQKAGPYRDAAAEENRQQLVEIVLQKVRRLEAEELDKVFLPYVQGVERAAFQGDTAKTLNYILDLDPPARFANEVQTTVASLEDRKNQLTRAAERLAKAGPYHQEFFEKARQSLLEKVTAEADLLRL